MRNEVENKNEKITAESAQKMLSDEGIIVSIEQTKSILFFLRKLANIAVTKYLRKRR